MLQTARHKTQIKEKEKNTHTVDIDVSKWKVYHYPKGDPDP